MENMQNSGTERAREQYDDPRHKAENLAETARERTGEVADQVREKAQQAAGRVDEAMTAAGQRMNELADNVRSRAPDSGRISTLATGAADALERSGTYLQQADLTTVRMDLESLIRRHPVESLLIGASLGFLLARSMRR